MHVKHKIGVGAMASRNVALMKRIDRSVKDRFVYADKDPGGDQWRSFATELRDDKDYVMVDDCDTLASTVLEILAWEGVPLENLFRALVSSPAARGNMVDHMVGLAKDENGTYWVVGDTFGPPVTINRTPHKIIEVSCIDTGISWLKWPLK